MVAFVAVERAVLWSGRCGVHPEMPRLVALTRYSVHLQLRGSDTFVLDAEVAGVKVCRGAAAFVIHASQLDDHITADRLRNHRRVSATLSFLLDVRGCVWIIPELGTRRVAFWGCSSRSGVIRSRGWIIPDLICAGCYFSQADFFPD